MTPSVLATLAACLPAQDPVLGEPLTFDLAPEARSFEGEHANKGWRFRPPATGTLYVWAESEDRPLHLRCLGEGIEELRDQLPDAPPPIFWVDVESGKAYTVLVACMQKETGARVTIHMALAPETEETRAAGRRLREATDRIRALRGTGEIEEALRLARETLDAVGDVPGAETSRKVNDALWELAAREAPHLDPDLTLELWRRCLVYFERYLAPTHEDVLTTRENRALALKELGGIAEARREQEELCELYAQLYPGSLALARTRANLGGTLLSVEDWSGARAILESAVEAYAPFQHEERFDLALTRVSLSRALGRLEEWAEAVRLAESALTVLVEDPARYPKAHMEARAQVFQGTRRLATPARAIALGAALVADFPEDWGRRAELRAVQGDLAQLLIGAGRLEEARALQADLVLAFETHAPGEERDLHGARGNLANTLDTLGDVYGALARMEEVLAYFERTLPPDADDLQRARLNLAALLERTGGSRRAHGLQQAAIDVWSKSPARRDHELHNARMNQALTLTRLGRSEEAAAQLEAVICWFEARLPPDHADLLLSLQTLATVSRDLGAFDRSRQLQERVLEHLPSGLPAHHPRTLNLVTSYPWTLALLGEEELARARVDELAAQVRTALHSGLGVLSPRELEVLATRLRGAVSTTLSFHGSADAEEDLVLCEALRCARLAATRSARAASNDPEIVRLRRAVRDLSTELARVAHDPSNDGAAWHETRRALEEIQRELAVRLDASELLVFPKLDGAALRETLGQDEIGLAFWSYDRTTARPDSRPVLDRERHLVVFVVERTTVTRVDLGPLGPIEAAIADWHAAVQRGDARGVRVTGDFLRRVLLEPVAARIADKRRLIVLPDAELHLLPFDALPLSDGRFLGDHVQVVARTTLWGELLPRARPVEGGLLVAFGDIDYDRPPAAAQGAPGDRGGGAPGRVLRSAETRVFIPLEATRDEVRALSRILAERTGDSTEAVVLEGRHASKEALIRHCARARWLHVATHGFFWPDPAHPGEEVVDPWRPDLESAASLADYVRGMNPMVLCGLALAGANQPPDALDRVVGVLTAQEMAQLDLEGCELAVLSACETLVGVRRAGQGVASFQIALHMAGARKVLTSLWKVDDEWTRRLMSEFYKGLWLQGLDESAALWRAKEVLIEAGRGERDWAGWVLSG